jgi:threonine dehydrogenase-like Zn-dependent dehydrogenase
MKAIVNTAPGQLTWQDWPTPQPGPGEVRIRTGACAICATDLHMIAGWNRTGYPAIPGHEWAGTVDAVGVGVDPGLVGQRCVAENVLSDGGEVGFEHPGAYGEYLITEAHGIQVLPSDYPLWVAALIEPLAVTVRAARRLRLPGLTELGESDQRLEEGSALVLGDGPIGLLMVALLSRAGVQRVVLTGGRAARLALGRRWGASDALNYHEMGEDLVSGIRQACEQPFAYVVEASGSAVAMRASLELAAGCGRVLMIGDYGSAHADFPWGRLLLQQIELIGSNASAGAWQKAVQLAVTGQVRLSELVTHRYPVERFGEAMALVRSRRQDVAKVILEWEPDRGEGG